MNNTTWALEGEQLRELLGQHRQVVASRVQQAQEHAREAGGRASEQAQEELAATLQTALAADEAATQLPNGRLTHALRPGVDRLATATGQSKSNGVRSARTGAAPRPGPRH